MLKKTQKFAWAKTLWQRQETAVYFLGRRGWRKRFFLQLFQKFLTQSCLKLKRDDLRRNFQQQSAVSFVTGMWGLILFHKTGFRQIFMQFCRFTCIFLWKEKSQEFLLIFRAYFFLTISEIIIYRWNYFFMNSPRIFIEKVKYIVRSLFLGLKSVLKF